MEVLRNYFCLVMIVLSMGLGQGYILYKELAPPHTLKEERTPQEQGKKRALPNADFPPEPYFTLLPKETIREMHSKTEMLKQKIDAIQNNFNIQKNAQGIDILDVSHHYSHQILLAILEFWEEIGLSDKATLLISGSFGEGLAVHNNDHNLSSDMDVWISIKGNDWSALYEYMRIAFEMISWATGGSRIERLFMDMEAGRSFGGTFTRLQLNEILAETELYQEANSAQAKILIFSKPLLSASAREREIARQKLQTKLINNSSTPYNYKDLIDLYHHFFRQGRGSKPVPELEKDLWEDEAARVVDIQAKITEFLSKSRILKMAEWFQYCLRRDITEKPYDLVGPWEWKMSDLEGAQREFYQYARTLMRISVLLRLLLHIETGWPLPYQESLSPDSHFSSLKVAVTLLPAIRDERMQEIIGRLDIENLLMLQREILKLKAGTNERIMPEEYEKAHRYVQGIKEIGEQILLLTDIVIQKLSRQSKGSPLRLEMDL